ncbi:YhcN/YlaJ family sporulation lipoprotein [Bacillus sp. FJAT-50079]|uniref:YhcN/YlaJ family sporulation lipoprotein n=1 Tax=Bacillus sp. FJAT-50079 TaxID=2833577 RepID=UPI001BC96B38|nr:YhcN/YlaJ family sporulation lipoprotein [Bacillus sp. FJAT-50079]MBS4207761.1 YhcN/YlaJ family sporulation lipoprotein [Bacillus sp. FJAT-50079]
MKNLLLTLILISMLTACTQKQTTPENKNMNDMPQTMSVKDSHINMADIRQYTDEERANYLANLAGSLPNVNGATAVVFGTLALVGIDVDKDLDRSRVGTIKYSVAESIKNDPQGAGAIVIADPDLTGRIKAVQQDIEAGKPLQGIMNELSAIIGRLIPEVPQMNENHNPQEAPEKPKQEMDPASRNELDKEQQDQSNDHMHKSSE